jgi:hypothetical protein
VGLATALLAATGCSGNVDDGTRGAEATAAPEHLGESAERFTNGWYFRTWFAATDFDTGLNPAYWTCFLAGAGGVAVSGPEWGLPTTAYAGAMIEGGTWHHVARNGFTGTNIYGNSDMGSAIMCVPSPMKVAPAHWVNWTGTTPALKLASSDTDPNVVCGLAAISSGATGSAIPWETKASAGLNSGSSAYVFQNSGQWWIGGAGAAEAWATCTDRTPGTPVQSWDFNGGSSSSFFQADIGHYQCFLGGFGGYLDASFGGGWPNPWQQGVWIGYDFSNLFWTESVTANMSAKVYCIQ